MTKEGDEFIKLNNFEQKINDVILDRGWDYYQDDCIKSITLDQDTNTYTAVVVGADDYTVTVQLEGNDILAANCNCPYDMGPFCKHEVAVFYMLQDGSIQDGGVSREPIKSVTGASKDKNRFSSTTDSPGNRYVNLLAAQPKERLVEFLASLCLEDDQIRSRVGFEFNTDSTDTEDNLKSYIELIRSSIRQHSDRDGFVEYGDADGATEGAWMVLQRAEDAENSQDYFTAAALYLCVLHEIVPLLQFADDSGGYIGGTIEKALSGVGTLAEKDLPADTGEKLFRILLEESANPIYDGWTDWRLNLLEHCAALATTDSQRGRLEEQLNTFGTADDNSGSSRYLLEQSTLIRYELIRKFDGEEKAAGFIKQKISLPRFREMAIENALSTGDYDYTIKLALDGEVHDTGLYGLIKKWKDYRYEAYKLSGQLENQRKLAMEFILEDDFDYYQKLKSTYKKQDWMTIYPGILQALESTPNHSRSYPNILIGEYEFKKLLEFVKAQPNRIVAYHEHLLSDFADEVFAIWTQHILASAQRANNRRDYQGLCSYIRMLIKDGGIAQANQVISQLLSTYPRKSALREELNKITA